MSYHHLAVSYIRGKWGNEEKCGAPMLLAKCCHDLDLMIWLKSGVAPTRVSSFGGDFQFAPEKTPPKAGWRCMVDCPMEQDCLYSARKHYIDHPDRWAFYVWDCLENLEHLTLEDKDRFAQGAGATTAAACGNATTRWWIIKPSCCNLPTGPREP